MRVRRGAAREEMVGRLIKKFAPRKLYRIGEVMQYSGLSRQMVHHYTMLRLIQEAERTEAGHRLYGEDVFEKLARIKELKKTRTLREIQEMCLSEERRKSS
ncbi:MAG: MerR family DNA-binding transcriptional regulator [Planctomycetota bacterium]